MTRFQVVRRAILAERSIPRKLLGTAVVLCVATIVRWLLGASAQATPFVTYFPAVVLIALFYGWHWGAGGTAFASRIVSQAFLPLNSLVGPDSKNLLLFVYFGLSCAFLIMIAEALRRTIYEMDVIYQERDLLMREMQHRVKNALGSAIALVRRGGSHGTVEEFREELEARLTALGKATDLLLAGKSEPTLVRAVVEDAIMPFDVYGSVKVDGPEIHVGGKTAYQLALIIHELCTNALKHGALSSPAGGVSVTWNDRPAGPRISWQERGGPPVAQPVQRGFGTSLLRNQDAFDIHLDFHLEGLRCELVARS